MAGKSGGKEKNRKAQLPSDTATSATKATGYNIMLLKRPS
jgi:hypothetical protein